MVKCDRLALISFIHYIEKRLDEVCFSKKNEDYRRCVLNELELLKIHIMNLSIEDIERELFGG